MIKQVPENPAKNRNDNSIWLVVVAALTVTCYITANIMAVKMVEIGGKAWFDAGTITFPIAYMLGDVLTEIWGFKTARKIILLTFVCNFILVVCTYIGVFLPSPEYMSEVTQAYSVIFTYTPRILAASLIAFVAGQISNAWVMSAVKKMTKGKYLFVRTITSSAVGYIFDTGVFVLIAYIGTAITEDIVSMIVVQYIAKLAIEAIFSTPLAYGAVAFLKRKAGVSNE